MATKPSAASRALTSRETVVAGGSVFQIALRADCISPNTPVAVISSVTSPTMVATVPLPRLLAPWIIDWSSSALLAPIRPLSWSTMAPWAA